MGKIQISKLESHLGYWLRCLSNYVHHSFAAKLEVLDISVAQWVALRVLYDNESLSLTNAAQVIGVDSSSLSRLMERLAQKGLVARLNCKDRRSIALSLTVEGKKLVPILAKLADENDEDFFKSLSPKEKEVLQTTIQKLLKTNSWNISTHGKDRLE